jgi:RHS repeat-associated protein
MQQETWSEFIYRADNRMVEYSDSQGEQWEYRYDSFGRRYEKERFGSAHPEKDVWRDDQIWYVGLTHNILAEYTDIEYWNDKTIQTGLEYLVGPGGRAYGAHERYTRNGHEWSPSSWKNRRYYHYDRLGSATAISLDKPGVAGESFNYGPFGDVLDGEHRWGWDYNGNHHMGFDSVGFTGYRIDAESGLYHAPFREYDPLVANWTTSDPIKSGELWYAYCSNNPVMFTDPLGLDKEHGPGKCDGSLLPLFQKREYTPVSSFLDILINIDTFITNTETSFFNVVPGLINAIPDIGLFLWKEGVSGFGLDLLDSVYYGIDSLGESSTWIEAGEAFINPHTWEDVTAGLGWAALLHYSFKAGASNPIHSFDDAAVVVTVDPNKLNHIFGKQQHGLGNFLKQFGGDQTKAFNAIQQAIQQHVTSKGITGVFEQVVNVGGTSIIVRGNVIDGIVKIGTAFIP